MKTPTSILGDVAPIEAAIHDRLVCAINGKRTGPRPPPQVFLFLVTQDVAMADARQDLAHVAGFETRDARTAFEEAFAELFKVVAVRRRQTDTRHDDAVSIGQRFDHEVDSE